MVDSQVFRGDRSPKSKFLEQGRWKPLKRWAATFVGGCAIALSLLGEAALADPFRAAQPHAVGEQAEAAFNAMFKEGDYKQARELLRTAEDDEPLTHALRAAIAYLGEDWDILERSSVRTRESAEALVDADPLRGHLYIAVGHFLEGAYIAHDQGLLEATPTLLRKLQQVFSNLNDAEKINPDDPELNLVRGFMDLMLAVNLPFSDPAQAIARLQEKAGPDYMANRGIAIGYRDLNQFDDAIRAVDSALADTPDNPDLLYLKAQILVRQGQDQASLDYFQQALQYRDRLVKQVGNRLAWEECRTRNRIGGVPDAESRTQCSALIN
ncbi:MULTISPECIES: Sll0314/Alr1548 family TPR repeat-containing protein [unclassified Leptolyngbya]|nr:MULTISPECIES: Sll0314/Alr1548 family TPR repeat-containing protein [unclassified Leptolyngbya]MBD1911653.1 hypothetical protein [Leptolyngbya sp. FACHB-8]MBD2154608.1 hypothetical protein [Leptolyngbya sp. FACHB-16]